MPRKKKSAQSPARAPGLSTERGVNWNSGKSVADQAMARNETKNSNNVGAGQSTNVQFSGKEEIVNKMQEMFSHLEPEVIYLVLNECDFRVEHAMDSLLELSVAADGTAPGPAVVSGFELAAALLYDKPQQNEPSAEATAANGPPVLGGKREEGEETGNRLTAEFDTLIDREMESLSSQPPLFGSVLPPIPQDAVPSQALPELLQSSVGQDQRPGLGQQVQAEGGSRGSRTLSPLSGLSFSGPPLHQEGPGLLDFSHLTTDSASRNPTLDLGSLGRPSAFQAYKKSPKTRGTEGGQATPSTCGDVALPKPGNGSSLGPSAEGKEPLATPSLFWNMQAPEFQPQNPGPAFITPVVLNPMPWGSQPVHHWFSPVPVQQAPLKPAATIPKSWALPAPSRPLVPLRSTRLEGKVLVLLRGAPGAGKSTMARSLLIQNPGGVVLCSDEFFIQDGHYRYNPALLGEAHEWNHCRAKEAFEKNMSPIIIDNTNMQCWEMKPYVALAKKHNYKVMFREPDTWWKFKPRELERRTKHGVSKEKIRRMLERYERHVSVDSVMHSFDKRPELSDNNSMALPLPETSLSQPLPSEVKPDLVEEPYLSLGLAQGYGHAYSHAQLFSSLPDVSSVGRGSAREQSLGAGDSSRSSSLQGFNVSLPPQELLDASALDWELDTLPTPECNTQAPEGERTPEFSGQNQDRADEQPAAFSESISQRVRRDRTRPRQTDAGNEDGVQQSSGNDTLPGNDSQCEWEEEVPGVKAVGCDRVRPELLDFVGDWPSEGMEQREQRLRAGRGKGMQLDGKSSAEQDGIPRAKMAEGAERNKSEFQKLLDLLQIGTSLSQKESSPSVSSPIDFMLHSSTEDLSKDPEHGFQGSQSPAPSSTEGLDQKAGRDTRPEILDCVADWTLSDITPVRDAPQILAMETPPPSPARTAIFTPERGSERKKSVEECETSPECRKDLGPAEPKAESPGGTVTSPVSGGSQERRFRQSRRSGKQCKLALTFTSPTSPRPLESPLAAPHSATITPESPAPRHTHRSAQTDPGDFALLWRLDRQRQEDVTAILPDVRVLVANCTHFQPGPLEPPTPQVVPYRMVHDKGTQVEEQDLVGSDSSKVQDLQILCRHFKLVSSDTLEDLYDKCHQDIEWTTNLLLDSGEELFKDDEDDPPRSEEEHPAQRSGLDPKADSPKVCGERDTPILLGAEQLKGLPDPESQGVGADGSFLLVETHPVPEESPAPEEPTVRAQCSSGLVEPSLAAEENSTDLANPGELSIGQPKGELDAPTQLLNSREAEAAGGLAVGSEYQADPPQEEGSAALLLEEEQSKEPGDLPSLNKMTWSLVSQLQEMNRRDRLEEQKERDREREREGAKERAGQAKQDHTALNIQSLELKLPAELAFQLSELFGPVGIAPGSWSPEDCSVQIDLNLARLLHQKWKETIQERQLLEALSYHLLQESSEHWGESQPTKGAPTDGASASHFLFGTDGFPSLSQSEAAAQNVPFMDHWNAPQSHVSLRDIMLEEQVLQEHMEKSRESQAKGRKDGAALLKEQQLYSMFPNIDRHFLHDIFKAHNYSLEQTTQFLTSLLHEEPVRTVVASDTAPPSDAQRARSNERRRKGKEAASVEFQDTQDPAYEDFRTEATLQRRKQQESFSKAAEAYRQGMKDVASFYAQQGHLHGQKMREANNRAAMLIFERVNATLLPENILDLHGLHVDEALFHLQRVLEEKTVEWQQGGCRPQLSVITGRGNHSQGGVARIRPAVIDYLTTRKYTFTEPKCGLVLVTLH
ncbi:NEDD4-binding protein 2 isoform X2 [Conger conger]|uniref:NEDD4-binding protein 2 isoform X2 n=1 Tax=Conger conger TaxID=82655 RepID=UPI002A5AF633|nr:NEDD4-binding protein 2 isoform X2 [Conger conger]